MSRRVAVVGGGVIGLSIAQRRAEAGDRVTVYADTPAHDTVSARAGAVWFPFGIAPKDRVKDWSITTLARLRELAATESAGVRIREGLFVVRRPDADLSWTTWIDGVRHAEEEELPSGAPAGFIAALPIVEMPLYLQHLTRACLAASAEIRRRRIGSLDEISSTADVIVVAAGIRSADLLPDRRVFPVRGQVVRLENPGVTRWLIDEDNALGLTYVLPRSADVVCGGTADAGRDDTAFDEREGERILERVRLLVPELARARVLSTAVGIRPARDEVRLERLDRDAVPVIACYGHGGGGVTTSWGCAEEVSALIAAAG